MNNKLYDALIKNLTYARGFTNRSLEELYEQSLREEAIPYNFWNDKRWKESGISNIVYHNLSKKISMEYGFEDGLNYLPPIYKEHLYKVFLKKMDEQTLHPFDFKTVDEKLMAFIEIINIVNNKEVKSLEDVIISHLLKDNDNNDEWEISLYSLIDEAIRKRGLNIENINSYCNQIKDDVIEKIIDLIVKDVDKTTLFDNAQEMREAFKLKFLYCDSMFGSEYLDNIFETYGKLNRTLKIFFNSKEVTSFCKELVDAIQ